MVRFNDAGLELSFDQEVQDEDDGWSCLTLVERLCDGHQWTRLEAVQEFGIEQVEKWESMADSEADWHTLFYERAMAAAEFAYDCATDR